MTSEVKDTICPLQNFTEEMIVRLEEFENIISVTSQRINEAKTDIFRVILQKESLFMLCKRIDDMERFIDITEKEMEEVEKIVNVAEKELGFKEDKKFSGLFKNLFDKQSKETNLNSDGKSFRPLNILDSTSFFQTSENEYEDTITLEQTLLDEIFLNDVDEGGL